jgi:hypothetical protein
MDEAMLANNIVERPISSILQPMENNQAAPPGFQLIEKGLILCFGNRDFVLRMFPLVSGLATLVLMALVCKQYLKGSASWLALGLVVVSDSLIYNASELKQYSSDTAIGLGLIALAAVYDKPEQNKWHWILLALAGSAAVWFSHPSIFILAAIGISLGLLYLSRKAWPSLVALLAVGGSWISSFAMLYFTSLRLTEANEFFARYWADYFMPLPPWQNPGWFITSYQSFLRSPVGLNISLLASGLLLVGIVSLFIRQWQHALRLMVPFGLVLIASGLQKYPFGDRLALFLVPLVFLLIAEGANCLGKLLRGPAWISSVVPVLVMVPLLITPTKTAFGYLQWPHLREESKASLLYIRNNLQPGDRLYVYYSTIPTFQYYAARYGLDEIPVTLERYARETPQRYNDTVNQLRPCTRFWAIFTHVHGDEEVIITTAMDQIGERLDEYHPWEGSVYLYACDPVE